MRLLLVPLLTTALLTLAGSAPGQEHWSLKTSDTSLRVAVKADQLTLTSLSATGRAPDWIKTPVVVPFPDHIFLGGSAQPLHWKFSEGKEEHAANQTTLRFTSAEPRLELVSVWQAQNGPG